MATEEPTKRIDMPIIPTKEIRLLCVDDHPLVRDGIAYAIQNQRDMVLVAETSDGVEALNLYREHLPDVTLMDLRMPNCDGVGAIEAIRAEFPKARIIVLTTYRGDVRAERALKAGAVGYVLKSMLRTELMNTIRAVHAGHRHIAAEISSDLETHLAIDALSERETEVLQLVSEGHPNRGVADRMDISEDTVKSHMRSILAKLQANDRTHAVMIGLKRGFIGG